MKNWLKRTMAILMLLVVACCTAGAEEEKAANAVVYFQDGSRALIPASIANDPDALSEYCNTYFPGRVYTTDANVDLSYDAVLSAEGAALHFGQDSTSVGVALVTLGLNTSVVSVKGQELTVPTSELTFDGGVDQKHLLGVVLAPRTGEATLRETASGSGAKVTTCLTGRIAAVLEYTGGTYTKILYDGEEGYIRTDCLVFHDGSDVLVAEGVLHVNGATDGEKSVNVRTTASSSTAKVAAWKTGTSVRVYGEEDGWYAVESDGWFGYVPKDNLTLDGE